MTSKERIQNILNHRPVDRVGIYEHFWGETVELYKKQRHITPDENSIDLNLSGHFGFDIQVAYGAVKFIADIGFVPKVIDETEETVTTLDGNGASLRSLKNQTCTPEHIDFSVKTGNDWRELRELVKQYDERRINFESYRKSKKDSEKSNRFFAVASVNVFEAMHPVCGHENMLMGMALEPEWIAEMADTYADFIISNHETLFSKEGKPDAIWFYEDMGFKERPFMSPDMYRELIKPAHKKTIGFFKANGISVIMHSCGYIRPLLPDMIDAGIDCLQAMEVKAGMDLLEIYKNFGDKIALIGGIDIRALCTNDKKIIDKELESKIPIVKAGMGYVVHSDHSVPEDVEYDTYRYFMEKALELGKY